MKRECPDCKVSLEAIRIVDATQPGMWGKGGATHVDLQYAPLDANVSWFTRTVKETESINGMICPQCRLIRLYG